MKKSDVPAASYIRVSSEEQKAGWSLDGQEEQIQAYAEQNGYRIVKVYQDESTGSKDKRPGLEQMLLDAHNGHFNAIIVINTSRFFRNVALARRYKDLLRNKLGIDVIFMNQPNMDPNDPTAFIMEGMNELFDEYYLHQLRFWTSLGKQTRAKRGMWNGTLPFGYMTGEDGIPVPHPQNVKGLRMAFEAYATGNYSDRQIADLLNREGYRTTGNWGQRKFTKDTINPLLQNVFYLGFTKYKGELFPGLHEPIIAKALFDKCQEVRAARGKHRRAIGATKRVYIFSGLARCQECNLTLRCLSTNSKGKYRYYRHTAGDRGYDCSVPGLYVRADELEGQWSKLVSAIQLPADWQEQISHLAGDLDEKQAIIRERDVVEERLRRLKELYQDLLIDAEEYRTKRDSLQKQLASLIIPEDKQLIQAGEYLASLGPLWEAATLTEKKKITRVMLKSVHVDVPNKVIVAVEPVQAFRILLQEVCDDIGVTIL